MPGQILFCRDELYFAVTVVGHRKPTVYDAVSEVWLCYELMIFAKINSLKELIKINSLKELIVHLNHEKKDPRHMPTFFCAKLSAYKIK